MKSGNIEYKMSNRMAKDIIRTYTTIPRLAKLRPQEMLVHYVNEQCGLMRNCSKVITYDSI